VPEEAASTGTAEAADLPTAIEELRARLVWVREYL
jgi:hypothetical protein